MHLRLLSSSINSLSLLPFSTCLRVISVCSYTEHPSVFCTGCAGELCWCSELPWARTDAHCKPVSLELLRNAKQTTRGWSSQSVMPCRKKWMPSNKLSCFITNATVQQEAKRVFVWILWENASPLSLVYFLWNLSMQMCADTSTLLAGSDRAMLGWCCEWSLYLRETHGSEHTAYIHIGPLVTLNLLQKVGPESLKCSVETLFPFQ